MNFDKNKFIASVKDATRMKYAKSFDSALEYEKFNAVSMTLMEMLSEDWNKTKESYGKKKQASYLSAEYLMGRALGNNLISLGLYTEVEETLKELGISLNAVEEAEEDAGLGNGGLGRLAACFMDSAATEDLPLTGYGIRYDYGIFKQKFEDGRQVEQVDNWLKYGDPWSVRRLEDAVMVEFADETIQAIPYDTPIVGYGTNNINTLRLWKAESVDAFDFKLFNDQDYTASVEKKNSAEDISRVLYPNDSEQAGKLLRLKQQYFFVSASLQDMIKDFKKKSNDFNEFPEYYAIQLNDTHPAVAVPEMMRLLMDNEGLAWDQAWSIVRRTFAYTNHTILAEALEQWWNGFYKEILPRIYEILVRIDEQFVAELEGKGYDADKIESMRIISNDMIKMAWLSIYGSYAVNGVAYLHTELLKHEELNDWYQLYPNKFQNKTNGITQRRWMALANKELSAYVTELLGTDEWVNNLEKIKELEKYADDEAVLEKFMAIKLQKKVQLAEYIKEHEGVEIDPDSIFDIQVKRLHEYKRQLLNAFHILDLYHKIKKDPSMDIVKRTFIFGAKAAPGYIRAKSIIKFINDIADLVNNDEDVAGRIKVVFVQNYRVSYGERIFSAADLSEQISMAGKEASGTGNMKFMLNGTPTIGTLDGANVEIVEEAGEENNFIFGLTVEDVNKLKGNYDPKVPYMTVPGLKEVVDALIDVTFDYTGDEDMQELYTSLLKGASWHAADNYFVFEDFAAYRDAQMKVDAAYRDKKAWARKCWMNMCNASKFSSDRTIREYAKDIWNIEKNRI
ncbi:glycogen/starch/alpha-glucan phosphorylase [Acidaminobacter sp. JC074]|uniref:glycogen/starch/alpha-glucan phosphorylase n=1 Tax=Acidaminobacter sp. JC074 TaxID=2530199 RepID=UPI001F102740|nr:glycogen/starch/alpha-glucan phosphorylase [Acidaminobacter sp. JC074]MCH4888285.1 glycogen/starch/alpha-glucan phosphorylase [Acidaminobacter sp. JC074]